MATKKKDKIDKLVDKYKSANKAIKQREAHARGESPLAKRRAANAAKSATKVAKASRYARGGLLGAIAGASTYLIGKVKDAASANSKSLRKLQKDAANKKTDNSDLPDRGPGGVKIGGGKTRAATARPASEKKYDTTLAGIKKTKGGDYAVYKKGSADSKAFQAAYRSAEKGTTFTWRGRKYKKP
jgi:hypothetical protein